MGKSGTQIEVGEKAREGGHSGWGWHSGRKTDLVSGCFLPGGAETREGKKGAGEGVVESSSCLFLPPCQGLGEPSAAPRKSWCVSYFQKKKKKPGMSCSRKRGLEEEGGRARQGCYSLIQSGQILKPPTRKLERKEGFE